MYLIPRLIGLFIYAIVLMFFYILVSRINRKDLGKLLFIYTIILSIMAYNFVPAEGNDLYRLIDVMHFYAEQNFEQIINSLKQSSTPVHVAYFYLIGKLRVDGLLAGITAFIFYRNIFYILKKFALRYSISSKNTALALLFFMATGSYMEVISGIRTMLGISIVAVCFYDELIEGKSIFKNVLWYIIAMLMHPVALAIIIIRILFMAMESSKSKFGKLRLGIVLIILAMALFKYGNRYIISMGDKVIEYVTLEDGYSYFWEYVIGIIDLTLILVIQGNLRKDIKKFKSLEYMKNYLRFSWVISAVVIIFLIVEYNTFHRLVIFNSILVGPILMETLNNGYKKSEILSKTIFITSIIMLAIACARGNLCSLKFFM